MLSEIAITAQNRNNVSRAEQLAEKLNLPICQPGYQYRFVLKVSEQGLELAGTEKSGQATTVRVDFTTGRAAHRRRQHKREMLVRAVGFKQEKPPVIIDATGGLGRDSFILASAGCQVQIFERIPVIAALLADGLKRAALHPETAKIVSRIKLSCADALNKMQNMQQAGETTDVVYLDPMFPKRQKAALVKKELQMLQILAQDKTPPAELLSNALSVAKKRVVVKRPKKSSPLSSLAPSHSLSGKTIRFDVYMKTGR